MGKYQLTDTDITVVDARMGRGKTSAAIRFMIEHKDDMRFVYATPYLDEVDRICECCDFDDADNPYGTKSSMLISKLEEGRNVAITHELFSRMGKDAIKHIKEKGYVLIIDESLTVVERPMYSAKKADMDILINSGYISIDSDNILRWDKQGYTGVFERLRAEVLSGTIVQHDGEYYNITNPKLFRAFSKVFTLTYMFEGQYQKLYFDHYNFTYDIIGVESDDGGYYLSDRPDNPPPIDYRSLITILDSKYYNCIGTPERGTSKKTKTGRPRKQLSHNWYNRANIHNSKNTGRGKAASANKKPYDFTLEDLKNRLIKMLKSYADNDTDRFLWTVYKDVYDRMHKLDRLPGSKIPEKDNTFLQLSSKATNKYRDKDVLAYCVNLSADPTLKKFFKDTTRDESGEVVFDEKKYALSMMVQWVWRSAIRCGKPITLYIPSEDMRNMFIDWMDEVSKGGEYVA